MNKNKAVRYYREIKATGKAIEEMDGNSVATATMQ